MEEQEKSSNFLVIAAIIGLVLIIGAVAVLVNASQNQNKTATPNPTPVAETPLDNGSDSEGTTPPTTDKKFTKTELATYTGKSGKDCYVAVDGTVYKIDSDAWSNGVHTPANGQATCGKDLTSVIKNSPHGKSVLKAPAAIAMGTLS